MSDTRRENDIIIILPSVHHVCDMEHLPHSSPAACQSSPGERQCTPDRLQTHLE